MVTVFARQPSLKPQGAAACRSGAADVVDAPAVVGAAGAGFSAAPLPQAASARTTAAAADTPVNRAMRYGRSRWFSLSGGVPSQALANLMLVPPMLLTWMT